jgi:sugar phosphate isomerase/epimerase
LIPIPWDRQVRGHGGEDLKISQVAAQLYTVRDHTKTPRDLARTLRKIRSMGYGAVQVSAVGPVGDDELADMLDGEGLVCCVTHEKAGDLFRDPGKVIDKLKRIKCRHTAYAYPDGVDLTDPRAVARLVSDLDEQGRIMSREEITLSYHNHQLEFRRIDGKLILEKIYDEATPAFLKAELDVYWIQLGGGDPVAWCRKLDGRLPLIHLKDYMVTTANAPAVTHLGNGNLDMRAIVAAAERSGCEWFIVEQDDNWVDNDPFEALRRSYEYLRESVCEKP